MGCAARRHARRHCADLRRGAHRGAQPRVRRLGGHALKLDPHYHDGWYERPPLRGLLAFGHVYAAWLFSQDFFRERLYERIGLASADDVVKFTQNYFSPTTPTIWWRWRKPGCAPTSAPIRASTGFRCRARAIGCRAIVMPGDTDLYFRVADRPSEVARMPHAELRPIPSKWGHGAGFGIDPADNAFVDAALAELLA